MERTLTWEAKNHGAIYILIDWYYFLRAYRVGYLVNAHCEGTKNESQKQAYLLKIAYLNSIYLTKNAK